MRIATTQPGEREVMLKLRTIFTTSININLAYTAMHRLLANEKHYLLAVPSRTHRLKRILKTFVTSDFFLNRHLQTFRWQTSAIKLCLSSLELITRIYTPKYGSYRKTDLLNFYLLFVPSLYFHQLKKF